jgi:glutathione S-transferase
LHPAALSLKREHEAILAELRQRGEEELIKFFYAPHTCALASHIALVDAGASYETVRLDFRKEEQRKPEYLSVNPKGRVPSLVTDRGALTETPAILAFIAQSFPAAKLAPVEDAFAFAKVQAFNSYLCSTVHVAHAHRMRGSRWADDPAAIAAMQKKVPMTVSECFALIEREMIEGPFVMGKSYTVCDPYLFTLSQWLDGDGVDIARFPKVHEHRQRMAERPQVKQALAEEGVVASVVAS